MAAKLRLLPLLVSLVLVFALLVTAGVTTT